MTNDAPFVAIPEIPSARPFTAEWNAFSTLQSQIQICGSPAAGPPILLSTGRNSPDECVRAKMVAHAAEYRWSNASRLKAWLNTGSNGQDDEFIRKCTTTGRPCGDPLSSDIYKKRPIEIHKKETGLKPKVQQEQTSLAGRKIRT